MMMASLTISAKPPRMSFWRSTAVSIVAPIKSLILSMCLSSERLVDTWLVASTIESVLGIEDAITVFRVGTGCTVTVLLALLYVMSDRPVIMTKSCVVNPDEPVRSLIPIIPFVSKGT